MHPSTLRNYIHAMGGVLQIQAIFPDEGAVVIDRFGDYEDRMYVVRAKAENGGVYRLVAHPFQHQGAVLTTSALRASGFVKTMKALHAEDPQISGVRKSLENGGQIEVGGRFSRRVYSLPELVAAGFEVTEDER